MFQKFEIHGAQAGVDQALRDYAAKKIGGLDRYVPRHARQSAHAEVYLSEAGKKANHSQCEITLRLPRETIVIKEKAINMYAAIDISQAKLKQRLKKYKDIHANGKFRQHVFSRFRRQNRL